MTQFQGNRHPIDLSNLDALEELQLNASEMDYIPPILQNITSNKLMKVLFILSDKTLGIYLKDPRQWAQVDLALKALFNRIQSARGSTRGNDHWYPRVSFLVTHSASTYNVSECGKRILPRVSERECVDISGEFLW
jgi:hypothetical protein